MNVVPDKLKKYVGRRPEINDTVEKIGYELSVLGSDIVYNANTADHAIKDRQIIYNDETVEYVYADFTSLTINYAVGTRPLLERIINMVCADIEGDREKVLAILDYVYRGHKQHNVNIFPQRDVYILNAMEEEISKLSRVSCECHSRLIICLCQIAGFPARNISTYSFVDPDKDFKLKGGHTMVEIYIEDKWSLFDSDYGFFCLMDGNRIAGLHDVRADPSLVLSQPNWVYESFGMDKKWHLRLQENYLSPHSVMSYSNYSANEYLDYDWQWVFYDNDAELSQRIRDAKKTLRTKLLEQHGLETSEHPSEA